jgi:VWFA-related protein
MRKLFAIMCVAGLLAAQTPQQSPPQNPPDQDAGGQPATFSSTTHNVQVPVTVLDRSGNSVPSLTPYDFRLFDNGKPQKISEDLAQHPLSIVVVIQANSDVESVLPKIMKQASALETLVVGSDGEVAVLAFDHRVQTLTPFTSDETQIDAAFKKLRVGSWTAALNQATMEGINMLKNRPATRRRVLLQISENRDKGSSIHPREVLTEAEFANIVIYSLDISQFLDALTTKAQPNRPGPSQPGSVFLGPGATATPTTESQLNMGNWVPAFKDLFDAAKGVFVRDPLDVYTHYTGGRECGFKTEKALATCVAQIGDELHSQYLLSYSPNNMAEAGFHKVIVEVMKPGLTVRARDGYWAAAKTE